MTTPNNQKRNVPQARPDIDIRDVIHEVDDARGLIVVAENDGDVFAYYGSARPPSPSTGSKKLYGKVLRTKNRGNAYGFYERPEGELQGKVANIIRSIPRR